MSSNTGNNAFYKITLKCYKNDWFLSIINNNNNLTLKLTNDILYSRKIY